MVPHHLTFLLVSTFLFTSSTQNVFGQKQKTPPGGKLAVVVDERLSALRATPELTGKLVRRLGRGKLVAIRGQKSTREDVVFYLVNISSRTHGWIQREAVASGSRLGDDQRLLALIKGSKGFDRISRARIFLDHMKTSSLRPEVLLLLGDAAEQDAAALSRAAKRRLDDGLIAADFSYFLNYSGLDRYNRQRVGFVFDQRNKQLHYDGAAWREILRRYPRTPQAAEAQQRLARLQEVGFVRM